MIEMTKRKYIKLSIERLTEKHVNEVKAIWIKQYNQYGHDAVPKAWKSNSAIDKLITDHAEDEKAVVANYNGNVVGFMTCDTFNFHNESTAFFPILGHCALDEYKTSVYQSLYSFISKILVKEGCLNHIITCFATDDVLKQYLFELGFGLYVVDAFQSPVVSPPQTKLDKICIRQAKTADTATLHTMMKAFNKYYQSAPLFLKRDMETLEDVAQCVSGENTAVFIAEKHGSLVGFIHVRLSEENDDYTLATNETAMIDPLGAFIDADYRHLGIGKLLLSEVFRWCHDKKLESIHVDFESANQNAHQFWPRHFIPTLFSTKRRINNDFVF